MSLSCGGGWWSDLSDNNVCASPAVRMLGAVLRLEGGTDGGVVYRIESLRRMK